MLICNHKWEDQKDILEREREEDRWRKMENILLKKTNESTTTAILDPILLAMFQCSLSILMRFIRYLSIILKFLIKINYNRIVFWFCSWPLWGYAIACIFVNVHGNKSIFNTFFFCFFVHMFWFYFLGFPSSSAERQIERGQITLTRWIL